MEKSKKHIVPIMLECRRGLFKIICDPELDTILTDMEPALVNKLSDLRIGSVNNRILITRIGNSINESVETKLKFNE